MQEIVHLAQRRLSVQSTGFIALAHMHMHGCLKFMHAAVTKLLCYKHAEQFTEIDLATRELT